MIKDQFSSIQPAAVYKNYKELCEAIGEKPKTGNSRPKQLREIEEWLKLRKEGWKYIVEEVYEVRNITISLPPAKTQAKSAKKPYTEKRKRGRPKKEKPAVVEDTGFQPYDPNIKKKKKRRDPTFYPFPFAKYVKLVLLYYLSKSEDGFLYIGAKDAYRLIGLVNEKFGDCIEEGLFMSDTGIKYEELAYTKYDANQKARSVFMSALKSLKNEKLISYKEEIVLADTYHRERVATPDEEKLVLNTEKRAIEALGCKNISEVYRQNKSSAYWDLIEAYIQEMKEAGQIDWIKYRRVFFIIINTEFVLKEVKRNEAIFYRFQINDNMCNFLMQKMDREHPICKENYDKHHDDENHHYTLADSMGKLSYDTCMWKHQRTVEEFIRLPGSYEYLCEHPAAMHQSVDDLLNEDTEEENCDTEDTEKIADKTTDS